MKEKILLNNKEFSSKKDCKKKQKSKVTIVDVTYVGLFVALISICSWIYIPFVVPFSMQTFAIVLTVALLGVKLGTTSVCVYLALGAVGIPVFAEMTGGLGMIFGMTGGYLIGFIFTALVTGTIIKIWGKKVITLVIAMVLGVIACYFVGTLWFMVVYSNDIGGINLYTALTMCVFPYIIPDLCKIAIAITVVKKLGKYVKL